ncbi:hypothetical protein LUZ61_000760 [Rhynchospora tenuis]|uniref:VOC domain-containing protein n=1 Tax=Rhynchospora tenuis TaxID=198213 RepID=A0AAD5ZFQ9_9POAL|nr:hypothetical protein LUZ61_000760 [Rhynchospora tenuis]
MGTLPISKGWVEDAVPSGISFLLNFFLLLGPRGASLLIPPHLTSLEFSSDLITSLQFSSDLITFRKIPIIASSSPKKVMAAAAELGVQLNHIARESSDVKRLASFYQEILGFEQMETPNFGDFDVIWLRISPSLSMHIIQRDPLSTLPVSPYAVGAASSVIKDPKQLSRGHHLAFSVSNFDSFVHNLKYKGIEVFQKTQPDGKTKQVFFFDPDGNGLEVMSRETS